MNGHSEWCRKLEDYFDNEMNLQDTRKFREHLNTCERCRNNLRTLEQLRNSMSILSHVTMSDDSDLRIRRALHPDTASVSMKDEIMNIEGVARYLKVTVAEVVELLDQLPSFEVNGKIRFRKECLIEWIANQEKKFVREREYSHLPSSSNIVQFPGGKL